MPLKSSQPNTDASNAYYESLLEELDTLPSNRVLDLLTKVMDADKDCMNDLVWENKLKHHFQDNDTTGENVCLEFINQYMKAYKHIPPENRRKYRLLKEKNYSLLFKEEELDSLDFQSLLFFDNRGEVYKESYQFIKELIEHYPNIPFKFYAPILQMNNDSLLSLADLEAPDLFLSILAHPSMEQGRDHDAPHLFYILASLYDQDGIIAAKKTGALIAFIEKHLNPYAHYNLPEDLSAWHKPSDETAREKFNAWFKDFPQDDIWRLFYDGYLQRLENGWREYENREPGFMIATFQAFLFLIQTIDAPLSLNIILGLHFAATLDVKKLNTETIPGRCRNNLGVCFDLLPRESGHEDANASLAGLIQLAKNEKQPEKYKILHYRSRRRRFFLTSGEDLRSAIAKRRMEHVYIQADERPREAIEEDLRSLIADYNHEISRLSPIEKLLAIARLSGEMERIHPFRDGNCRTLCNMLVIRELIRNDFPPAILNNPNRLGGYSSEECVMEFIEGMKNFKALQQGDTHRFGLSTNEILALLNLSKEKGKIRLFQDFCQSLRKLKIGKPPQNSFLQTERDMQNHKLLCASLIPRGEFESVDTTQRSCLEVLQKRHPEILKRLKRVHALAIGPERNNEDDNTSETAFSKPANYAALLSFVVKLKKRQSLSELDLHFFRRLMKNKNPKAYQIDSSNLHSFFSLDESTELTPVQHCLSQGKQNPLDYMFIYIVARIAKSDLSNILPLFSQSFKLGNNTYCFLYLCMMLNQVKYLEEALETRTIDVNQACQHNKEPALIVLLENNLYQLLDLFFKHHVSLDVTNQSGLNPEQIARAKNDTRLLQKIQEYKEEGINPQPPFVQT